MVLPALAISTATATLVRGFRGALSTYVLVTPFLALYIITALITQLVLGIVDPYLVLINSGRMVSIALLATSLTSTIRVRDVVALIGRYSPTAALGTVLAIRFLYTATLILSRLHEIYEVNLSCVRKDLKHRLVLATSLTKALTYLTTASALAVSEALYTRYYLITERLRY